MHVEHAYHHLKNDLSSTALLFRLLRGNGLHASTGEKKSVISSSDGIVN
jgi:hypothetical protein